MNTQTRNTTLTPKSTSAPRRSASEEHISALVQAYQRFGLSESDASRAAQADLTADFVGLALAA